MGWERERYTWDAGAGTVTIDTLDSNLWGPGSGWQYRLTAADGGTDVHVTLKRAGKGLRGKLIGARSWLPAPGCSASSSGPC